MPTNPTEQIDVAKEARELVIYVEGVAAGVQDIRLGKAAMALKTLADEVERREKLVALAVRWRAERLRYQTDPTVTNRAYGEAADALAMEIENPDAVKDEEEARYTWQSFHNFQRVCRDKLQEFYRARGNRPIYKLWETECGNHFDELREICPSCSRRVWLTGFDAWWEARKSYHP